MRTFLAKSGWQETRVVKSFVCSLQFCVKGVCMSTENLNEVNAAGTDTGSAEHVLLLFQKMQEYWTLLL